MRFLYTLLLVMLLSVSQAFAQDIVYSRDGSTKGKIKTYVDGLIIIDSKGVEHLYSRSMSADYFGDYIQYRPTPFSKEIKETDCRILFVDRYTVIYSKSPSSKIEIPRYRIKTMIFNTK